MEEKLRCAAGHDFTRDVVRGKKPQWCPKHRLEHQKAAEALRMAEKPVVRTPSRRALQLLKKPLDPEFRRKLQYCVDQLQRERDSRDASLLEKRESELINEYERGRSRTGYATVES